MADTQNTNANFLLNRSVVSGEIRVLDSHSPHVYLLTIHDTPSRAFLSFLFQFLWPLVPFAKRHWPGIFLPQKVVLKSLKPGWDDEFQTEIEMYHMLESLQGKFIPIYYGETEYDGARTIVLSYVDGVKLCDVDMDEKEVRQRLRETFKAFFTYRAVPDNARLENFILSQDKIVAVDLEQVYIYKENVEDEGRRDNMHDEDYEDDEDDDVYSMKCVINDLVDKYRRIRTPGW